MYPKNWCLKSVIIRLSMKNVRKVSHKGFVASQPEYSSVD